MLAPRMEQTMASSVWKSTAPAATVAPGTRLVFLVGFVVLLVIALVGRGLALDWRQWLPGAEGEKTLIGGVRSAVYTFMSNIP
jgi:light-harvesting complex 1 beta chain